MNVNRKKSIYKEELKRAFFNKGMALSLIIGTILVALHSIMWLKLHTYKAPEYYAGYYIPFTNVTVTTVWIIKGSPYYYYIYYLLPMIAVLPFGLSYIKEKKTGLVKNIFLRTDRKKYVNRKFITNFFAGGVSAMYIPLLSLLVVLPFFKIQSPYCIGEGGFNSSTLCELYYKNTLLFVVIFLLLYFMVGGLFASISLTVSTFSRNRLTIFLTPFFIALLIFFLRNAMSESAYSIMFQAICPYDFLNCTFSQGYTLEIILAMTVMIVFNYMIFRKRVTGNDVF